MHDRQLTASACNAAHWSFGDDADLGQAGSMCVELKIPSLRLLSRCRKRAPGLWSGCSPGAIFGLGDFVDTTSPPTLRGDFSGHQHSTWWPRRPKANCIPTPGGWMRQHPDQASARVASAHQPKTRLAGIKQRFEFAGRGHACGLCQVEARGEQWVAAAVAAHSLARRGGGAGRPLVAWSSSETSK